MNLTELIWQFYHFSTICYEFYKKLKLEINSKLEPPGSKPAVPDLGQKQGTEQGRVALAGRIPAAAVTGGEGEEGEEQEGDESNLLVVLVGLGDGRSSSPVMQ